MVCHIFTSKCTLCAETENCSFMWSVILSDTLTKSVRRDGTHSIHVSVNCRRFRQLIAGYLLPGYCMSWSVVLNHHLIDCLSKLKCYPLIMVLEFDYLLCSHPWRSSNWIPMPSILIFPIDCYQILIHRGLYKMAAISQTTLLKPTFRMKRIKFIFIFCWIF